MWDLRSIKRDQRSNYRADKVANHAAKMHKHALNKSVLPVL